MFKRFYSFFGYCLWSCRCVMFQKRILSKPKWGAQTVVRRARPPGPFVETALQSFRRMEDQNPGSDWHVTWILLKGKGLETTVEKILRIV